MSRECVTVCASVCDGERVCMHGGGWICSASRFCAKSFFRTFNLCSCAILRNLWNKNNVFSQNSKWDCGAYLLTVGLLTLIIETEYKKQKNMFAESLEHNRSERCLSACVWTSVNVYVLLRRCLIPENLLFLWLASFSSLSVLQQCCRKCVSALKALCQC